jgi:hypothetical protein
MRYIIITKKYKKQKKLINNKKFEIENHYNRNHLHIIPFTILRKHQLYIVAIIPIVYQFFVFMYFLL